MNTLEKTLYPTLGALFIASIACAVALGIVAKMQSPEAIPDVPFPDVLRTSGNVIAEQKLVQTVTVTVLEKDKDAVFNAVISEIQAHGGWVLEYRNWADPHRLTAVVPETYLGRIAALGHGRSGRFTPGYRDWVARTGARATGAGDLTEIRVEVEGVRIASLATATALIVCGLAGAASLIGIVAVAGTSGRLDE